MTEFILWILPVAFVAELFDSSLGMGYGTTRTLFLLLFVFSRWGSSLLSRLPSTLQASLRRSPTVNLETLTCSRRLC
ncbi:MAG: hypothetical protein P1P76_06690 [Anaerolineales bacterium]|nr:hypothetical protein [Anaerolineales bacterium]